MRLSVLAALWLCLGVQADNKSHKEYCLERGGNWKRVSEYAHHCVCDDGLVVSTNDYEPEYCPGHFHGTAADQMRENVFTRDFLDWNDFYGENRLTYKKLKVHIKENEIGTVDAMLKSFVGRPQFEGLLKRYGLMKHSQSTQPGRRAILFTGNLFLGVSARPKNRRHDQVEVIEFDSQKQDFVFRVIDFIGGEAKFYDDAIRYRAENPTDSSVAKCTSCHGSPARPLWNSYKFWPNAFEQVSDSSLVGRLKPLVPNERRGAAHETGINLALLNYKRMVKRAKSKPKEFEKFKYAYMGSLVPCQSVESFFPEKTRQSMEKTSGMTLDQMKADVKASNTKEYARRIAREKAFGRSSRSRPDQNNNDIHWATVQEVAEIRYIVEGFGISMKDWSLSGGPGGTAFAFRENGGEFDLRAMIYEVLPEVAKSLPEIRKYNIHNSMYPGEPFTDRVCGILRDASLKQF